LDSYSLKGKVPGVPINFPSFPKLGNSYSTFNTLWQIPKKVPGLNFGLRNGEEGWASFLIPEGIYLIGWFFLAQVKIITSKNYLPH